MSEFQEITEREKDYKNPSKRKNSSNTNKKHLFIYIPFGPKRLFKMSKRKNTFYAKPLKTATGSTFS